MNPLLISAVALDKHREMQRMAEEYHRHQEHVDQFIEKKSERRNPIARLFKALHRQKAPVPCA